MATKQIRVYPADKQRIEQWRQKGETTAEAVSRLLNLHNIAEEQDDDRAISEAN